jgi:hypothetical protein
MGAILSTKELKSVSNMFVFNLAIADFCISLLVDSFTAVGVLFGKNYFDKRPGLCQFIAFACLVFCESSLISIGFLAFNRFIRICHSNIYSKLFTKKLTTIYCSICWLIGLLINLPNILGWSNFIYDKDTLNCMWNRLASRSYSIFFPLSSIIIPCFIILYFYLSIFIYAVRSHSRAISQRNGNDNLIYSLRVAKGLFVSYLLFVFCW